jgi:hypothetical protein
MKKVYYKKTYLWEHLMGDVFYQFTIPAIFGFFTALATSLSVVLPQYLKRKKLKKQTLLNGWGMYDIRNNRIRLSMDVCEAKILEIKILMRDSYALILDNLKINGKERIDEIRNYEMCVNHALKERIESFLYDIRENHFHLKTREEFENYSNDKVNDHLNSVTEYLNQSYYSDIIPREKLYEESRDILNKAGEKIRQSYDSAKVFSMQALEKFIKILDYEGVTDSVERNRWIEKL